MIQNPGYTTSEGRVEGIGWHLMSSKLLMRRSKPAHRHVVEAAGQLKNNCSIFDGVGVAWEEGCVDYRVVM